MTMTRKAVLLAALPLFVLSAPALALDLGVGVEGGVAGTFVNTGGSFIQGSLGSEHLASNSSAGGYALGLMAEERFDLVAVNLALWEDVLFSGIPFQTGGAATSTYMPVDVGLRLGLGSPLFQPYVGALVNDSFLTQKAAASNDLNASFFGAGGDLGCDFVIAFLRIGAEFRAWWTLTSIAKDGEAPPGGLALLGLLSARVVF